ncbi:MAG TPA: L-aspartate oxidase [Metabacillus sp.]|nr:L-aspartate oxidase [Metabacillus sp.]
MPQTDVIIIGSGLAALSVAYHLRHKHVKIMTKSLWSESNSMLAQGGIAAAVAKNDSWKNHFEDTMAAGCYHNNARNVEYLVQEGPKELNEWIQRGVQFDCNSNGELLLGKEGAHSQNRIIHAGGDSTGKELTSFLFQQSKPFVQIVENEIAIDLIMDQNVCKGVYTRNSQGEINSYFASNIIIASGGCGAVYGQTSNADVITGDGIAMAFRAGAELADMEFVQFHPTMLHINGKCIGLISEAVRGEGAILVTQNGEPFMKKIHHQADLAPRDIVSRAIFYEMQKGNHVFLDITGIKNFSSRFPTISTMCRRYGIDVTGDRIPVAPGMHFLMGGIKTNENGETNIQNLFAVGEAACTGVHGANRLASNSLLEGLVFGRRIANYINSKPPELTQQGKTKPLTKQKIEKQYLPTKKQIQEIMTTYVGIQRTRTELRYAINWFEKYWDQISFQRINVNDFTNYEIEVVNMLTIGWVIATSALKRTESRGGHYRIDFPQRNDLKWQTKQVIITKSEMFVGV